MVDPINPEITKAEGATPAVTGGDVNTQISDEGGGGELPQEESFLDSIFKDGPMKSEPSPDVVREGEEDLDENELTKRRLEETERKLAVRESLDNLNQRYGNIEGFPSINKEELIKYSEEVLPTIDPLEISYLHSNLKDILTGVGERMVKDAESSKKTSGSTPTDGEKPDDQKARIEKLKKEFEKGLK